MANPVVHFEVLAALEHLRLGGSTVTEPMDVPGGPTIALFADREGYVVGLVKRA